MLQLDRQGALEPVPFDEAGALGAELALPEEELRGSFHLVGPHGERWSGGEAVPVLARLLLGRAAAPLEAPAMRVLERRAYGWVTRHRGAFSRWLPRAPAARRRT